MRHGRASRRPAPHHRLHPAAPAQRAAGHPAGPDQFCGLPAVCSSGCVLVPDLPESQPRQLCCSPRLCHPLWDILCCLLLWLVFHSSFCPGDDELWHYEYGQYSQHPQVLLCGGHGIPHSVPHKQNIHISLWDSHDRLFWGAVMYKLCITLVSLILFLTLTKNFPMAYIIDNEFLDKTPFLSRLGYLYVVTQAAKPKYYFAWTLADAVNNAAGYGFSGVDERGTFRWDLLSNLNIWNIETATSFKMYIENWNIQTAAWLKRVCYDRAPWYPTALTFILSALWHGIYPGYYFTFLTGILITLAARAIRNNCRQYFLSSVPLKMAYDVATWAATQLAVCYTVAPFVMLAVEPTIKFYKSVYFHMHILSILVLLLLPIRPQASSLRRAQDQAMMNSVKSKDK
ncbi:lysophospholipid acyltransferase 1 isoform X4 [Pithys albifrons albifrons]|uniref:lysophospholipid acyltransferase 1 isoform X4 n=1 Tax=Pithys albifrons albifrons TaxID=3385563 RepID=UPI003A5CE0BD